MGGERIQRGEALDKGVIHVPGGTEWDRTRFHHATQNSVQFKAYDLFISRIFHFIFFGPQLTVGNGSHGKRNCR